jgi:hypothetical protein
MAAVYAAREGPPAVPLRGQHAALLREFLALCDQHKDAPHKKTRELAREFLNDWDTFWVVLDYPWLPLTNNEAYAASRIMPRGQAARIYRIGFPSFRSLRTRHNHVDLSIRAITPEKESRYVINPPCPIRKSSGFRPPRSPRCVFCRLPSRGGICRELRGEKAKRCQGVCPLDEGRTGSARGLGRIPCGRVFHAHARADERPNGAGKGRPEALSTTSSR